jgi:anti-sigma regulatory factor (Ser/Thr protein kinase)
VLAASEAASNVVRHAYGGAPGAFEVALQIAPSEVTVTVRDEGSWRQTPPHGRRGLQIMRGVMDGVEVEWGAAGTTVSMVRRRRR